MTLVETLRNLPIPARLSSWQLTLLLSLGLVLLYNQPLWQLVIDATGNAAPGNIVFLLSFFAFLVAFFNIILTLFSVKYLQKPLAIIILLSASLVGYFMTSYGVMIDKTMIQNAAETDSKEVMDLLSLKMLGHFLILGVLPSLLIYKTPVHYRPLLRELTVKTATLVCSCMVIGLIAVSFYKDYSSLFRNHREMRYLMVPTNYLYYGARYLSGAYDEQQITVEPLGRDAALGAIWQQQPKPVVTILVLGETARAANFSLNGYHRQTNPRLSQLPLYNFSDVSSCGTATAVSVPCMFSDITRDSYDASRIRRRENVLDILQTAGLNVLWRDNNSGCKGVCDRIESQSSTDFATPALCDGDSCFDEAMLHRLDDYLDNRQGNTVIVLHQLGSHGPAYAKRYPKAFERFNPVCEGADLQACSREQIVNAYDNSILYTDHLLAEIIAFLQQRSDRYSTAMLYLSDHGESLGENNIYLHGLPYFIAPETQTKVPMLAWLSDDYTDNFQLDRNCLAGQGSAAWSHDNLFHSLLGLLSVNTRSYDPTLDIFAPCRNSQD